MGEIGSYKYIQLVYQLRRDNGWEEVCDWGGLCVMRSTRPDAVPPPRLPELTENAKLHRKGQTSTAAMNLGFLLSLPFLAALKDTGLLSWQKLAAAAALVAAACFAVDRVLFHGVLSPEKWDDMSYEEVPAPCRRPDGAAVRHRRCRAHRGPAVLFPVAAADVNPCKKTAHGRSFLRGCGWDAYVFSVPSSRNSRVMHHRPAMPTSV